MSLETVDVDIYNAFATLVGTFAAAQSLPVSFPGVAFTPPEDGMWLEVRWFPNQPVNYGVGNEGPFLYQGFGQVSVCYRIAPLPVGLVVAGAVVEAFKKGTQLARVKVETPPYISAVVTEPDRLLHPVTIPYRGLLKG